MDEVPERALAWLYYGSSMMIVPLRKVQQQSRSVAKTERPWG